MNLHKIFEKTFRDNGFRKYRHFFSGCDCDMNIFILFEKNKQRNAFSLKALVLPSTYGRKVDFTRAFPLTALNPELFPKEIEESYKYKDIPEAEFQENMKKLNQALNENYLPRFWIFPLTNKSYWDQYICPDLEDLSEEQIIKLCQEDSVYNIALMEIEHQGNYDKAWRLMKYLRLYKEELSTKEKKLYRALSKRRTLKKKNVEHTSEEWLKNQDIIDDLAWKEGHEFSKINKL